MSDNGEIQVNSKVVERLKRSIIIKENMNLKTRRVLLFIKTLNTMKISLLLVQQL